MEMTRATSFFSLLSWRYYPERWRPRGTNKQQAIIHPGSWILRVSSLTTHVYVRRHSARLWYLSPCHPQLFSLIWRREQPSSNIQHAIFNMGVHQTCAKASKQSLSTTLYDGKCYYYPKCSARANMLVIVTPLYFDTNTYIVELAMRQSPAHLCSLRCEGLSFPVPLSDALVLLLLK